MTPAFMLCGLATMLLLMLGVAPEAKVQKTHPAPRDSALCYAFMRDGDIWTVCQREKGQISFHGSAAGFAVSADATILAVVVERDHTLTENRALCLW